MLPTTEEIVKLLSVEDKNNLRQFDIDLKKCIVVGHDFKRCIALVYNSYQSGIEIDTLLSLIGSPASLDISTLPKILEELISSIKGLRTS